MDLLDIVLGIVIVIGMWLTASKIQGYEFTISELKDENRKLEQQVEHERYFKDWAHNDSEKYQNLYEDLLADYEKLKEETNDKNSTLH